ncbi:MAG: V-type ATP synthase subunit E family protein [Sedimentibacter sp.]|uniref:V-type ATP synthase subunit E family protein n=1 Tax=Sedimentibacter sp. TaxID=1960295 RepID=UPI00298124B2|nr:V-type ATP synthase subunit E family protein [Sedimentibacter sp.]MDW5300269.1 V-type ATP synthase subunit E family protein [Sedimentibacter sp.]
MGTIEQKLLLFNKLLKQSMNEKFQVDLKELDDQFAEKLKKNKEEVDREAKEIEEKARKKAEAKKVESESKSRIFLKKEIISMKEKYYEAFIVDLKKKLVEFTLSEEYKSFLLNALKNSYREIENSNNYELIIYATQNDIDKYSDVLKQEILKDNSVNKVAFKPNNNILGGLVIEVNEMNFKIDMTIDAILEGNKTYIIQTVFETLEAGDYNG